MKKFFAVFLCVCLLVPVFSAAAGALPLSAGIDALRDEFYFGVAPDDEGATMDYYAFAPEGEGKFPLVVWLHGLVSGGYPGRQITKNDISYWASDEFQARFTNGGAFLLAPRSTEVVADWTDDMIKPLKSLIDGFIADNYDRVDLSRIYIGGLSMGAKMVYKMIAAYPEMFAAAFPCSPYFVITSSMAYDVRNTPIWQLSSKRDVYMPFRTWISRDWDRVVTASRCKDDLRWTVFETALKPDGTKPGTTHDTWYAATYDMFMYDNEPFTGSVTYDGNYNEVELTYPHGMISWLCNYTSDYYVAPPRHTVSIPGVFYRIYTRFIEYIARIVKAIGLKGVLG